jgi:hypothetical protein
MHNMHISMMRLKQCHKPSPHLTMFISGMVTISMGGLFMALFYPHYKHRNRANFGERQVDLSNIDSLLTNSPFLLKQGPPLKAFLSMDSSIG